MTDQKTVTALVATVVDDTQLAFNKGSNAGVEDGDEVTLHRSVEIKDPSNGEFLGKVLLPKLKLKVILVTDKYCVAVVTDRVAGNTSKSGIDFGLRPLKKVTTDPFAENAASVLVEIGEQARISGRRNDEPPF